MHDYSLEDIEIFYWLKKLFNKVIVPVSKTIPNPINKNTDIFSISNNFVLIFEKNIKNRSIATAEIRKGMANPAEYIPSKPAPVITDELVAAIVRIPAKIGPMQGESSLHQKPYQLLMDQIFQNFFLLCRNSSVFLIF